MGLTFAQEANQAVSSSLPDSHLASLVRSMPTR
jgi:hypothetical protein